MNFIDWNILPIYTDKITIKKIKTNLESDHLNYIPRSYELQYFEYSSNWYS